MGPLRVYARQGFDVTVQLEYTSFSLGSIILLDPTVGFWSVFAWHAVLGKTKQYMNINDFLNKLEQDPSKVDFEGAMAVIDAHYSFEPAAFRNGAISNKSGENNGSCKIFALGLLHKLSEQQTLACFGDYYRRDVLANPDNDDHQNIRSFIKNGWRGISFESVALIEK